MHFYAKFLHNYSPKIICIILPRFCIKIFLIFLKKCLTLISESAIIASAGEGKEPHTQTRWLLSDASLCRPKTTLSHQKWFQKIFKKFFKKYLTNRATSDIIKSSNEAKEIKAMSKNAGWYTFEDGYTTWRNGMSASERKYEIRIHGRIVQFIAG